MTQLIIIQEFDKIPPGIIHKSDTTWQTIHQNKISSTILMPEANDKIILNETQYLVKRKLFDYDNNLIKIFVKLDKELE